MNRSRKSNRGLPRRVYVKNGAYKFLSPVKVIDPADGIEKFWIKLSAVADGEPAMLSALANILGEQVLDETSIPYLCQEFRAHKLAKYGADTKKQYQAYLAIIAEAFGEFRVVEVQTKDWSMFLRNDYPDKINTARKITALGARLFRYAISELGLRKDNPLDQLDLDNYQTERRLTLPTHEQIAAIRRAGFIGDDGRKTRSGPMFACIIDMSYLCWARAIDVRTMMESQIELNAGELVGGRIRLKPTKTKRSSGLAVDLIITPGIAAVIERARGIKREYSIVSGYLFPATAGGHAGKPYQRSGLNKMWTRARARIDSADDIQFRDLRALGATDAAKGGHAKGAIKDRLVHTTEGTTDIYIKEAIPTKSTIDLPLPWIGDNIK